MSRPTGRASDPPAPMPPPNVPAPKLPVSQPPPVSGSVLLLVTVIVFHLSLHFLSVPRPVSTAPHFQVWFLSEFKASSYRLFSPLPWHPPFRTHWVHPRWYLPHLHFSFLSWSLTPGCPPSPVFPPPLGGIVLSSSIPSFPRLLLQPLALFPFLSFSRGL